MQKFFYLVSMTDSKILDPLLLDLFTNLEEKVDSDVKTIKTCRKKETETTTVNEKDLTLSCPPGGGVQHHP